MGGGTKWFDLDQDRGRRQVPVNEVMNCQFP
jgi:hypothetical protein